MTRCVLACMQALARQDEAHEAKLADLAAEQQLKLKELRKQHSEVMPAASSHQPW
jgi:hypothetical protein